MIPILKFKWSLLIIVLHFVILGYFAFSLPADARVPMHWNIHNEIDGYSSKTAALAFGAGMSVGLFLLLYLMPLYSPGWRKYRNRFENFIPTLCAVLVLFVALIDIYSLYLAKTGIVPKLQLILVLIGLLFIFIGNLLPKAPRNFFVGIRTPWTLSNDEIWRKTHRMGGVVFVISGFIMIFKGFVLTDHYAFQQYSGALAILILMYPLFYSFFLYRRLESAKKS